MKLKRFCAAALTAALMCSLTLPSFAAYGSSFNDVEDPATAVNADVLRLMGVVTGVGENKFLPENGLTRAEFCVMVTKFIQRGDEVSRYTNRTIFRDVTGSHWARGYVNLMATPVDGGSAMIAGVGDGSFAPEQKVTLAQAVTVLLRVLGYTSEDTGFIWPQSYLDLAASIQLTEGLPTDHSAVLTRAQAARLFVNALGTTTKSGQPYCRSLGSVAEDVILLAVGVTSDDGSSDSAIRTSLNGEAFLPASGEVSPTALVGLRGDLVLNGENEIVAFLPDESSGTTITLSGSAHPSYLKDTEGKRYTMSASTILYTPSAAGVSYIDGYTQLRSGAQLTLFTQSGKVTAVYAPGSAQSGADAVVWEGSASRLELEALTGKSDGAAILKNGQKIQMDQLAKYDVLTYDRLSNTLLVSDVRLVGVYEDAYPNPQAPLTITAMGQTFEVLDSAWENMEGLDIGDEICLLLTCDGKVAGVLEDVKANAVGLASESGVEVFLSDGGTLFVPGTLSTKNSAAGQLVELEKADAKGRLSVSVISNRTIPGAFDPVAMTLGKYPVSAGVRVFDQVKPSASVAISLADLNGVSVAKGDVKAYHLNSSGYVDCIVVDAQTGSAYTYGMCMVDLVETMDGIERHLSLENGIDTHISGIETPILFQNGQFSGVALGSDGKVKSVVALEKLEKVSPSDFFTDLTGTWLKHEGELYPVSEDVVCYKGANQLWLTNDTGAGRLSACCAFSDDLSAYYDPFVGQIRVVTAN